MDGLKHKILSYKNFSETYESLRPLCVVELMWMVERIEVEQIYMNAAEKDEQFKQSITSAA